MHRLVAVVGLCSVLIVPVLSVERTHSERPLKLAELEAAAEITRDAKGIAHIQAENLHDLYFVQGYVHAGDRLFQMDFSRRQASGTLAELLGSAALATVIVRLLLLMLVRNSRTAASTSLRSAARRARVASSLSTPLKRNVRSSRDR